MKEFLTYSGEYNYHSFFVGDMIFTLVGSRNGETNKIMDTVDTFKSNKGIFSERTRGEVRNAYLQGKILPLLTSIIETPDNNKTKRRSV